MSIYETVERRIKGKTEMPEELEKELIRRITVIEEEGGVCQDLPKSDWALTVIIAVMFGILPVIFMACGIF
ncbi:hypothetical protein NE619_05895 [Anaerovorax odorimutans]|uniref:Uncharacterized protein n=1 Tax=Anaerovorax odorimutans TaxID=109327 RepID=A0ABT1RM39_9FIRM|nr:hypothetical protein [Anaerovorax odorimutans]MCQ4636254.1 hypothetical protein [Anaerovorax odorimutans]